MMEALSNFFAMGGYAQFVWPAYFITALVLTVLVGLSLRDLRKQESMLRSLRHQRRGSDDDEVQ